MHTQKKATKPYHSLHAGGILGETTAHQPSEHEEHSAGDSEEGWQSDVGVIEKQAVSFIVLQQEVGTQAHQYSHHLANKRQYFH